MQALPILFLLLFVSSAFGQIDDFSYVTIELEPIPKKIAYARYYDKTRAAIKVELIQYSDDNGKTDFGKTYTAKYNSEKDAWFARVPKGWYMLRTKHIGFKSLQRVTQFKKLKELRKETLEVEGELPHCFEDGNKYSYIKGGIEFSETILVFFKSATPEENKAFMEENFKVEKIQKMPHINAFFLTLDLKNQEPLPEVLIRHSMGDQALPEGYYFGDAITQAIEKLQSNPNVKYANPSFIVPKSAVSEVKLEDEGSHAGMLSKLQEHKDESPKFLQIKDFEKSSALKRKLTQQLEE